MDSWLQKVHRSTLELIAFISMPLEYMGRESTPFNETLCGSRGKFVVSDLGRAMPLDISACSNSLLQVCLILPAQYSLKTHMILMVFLDDDV